MQRLKDKIEKWFGEGIEYKGEKYNFYNIDDNSIEIFLENDTWKFWTSETQYARYLSINDLCSVECSFLDSLDWVKDNSITITVFRPKFSSEISYQAKPVSEHRIELANLSDEDKILYILNNTK